MIPVHSNIGKGMRTQFESVVNWNGRQQQEVKSTETLIVDKFQQSGNEYGRAVRSHVQRKL